MPNFQSTVKNNSLKLDNIKLTLEDIHKLITFLEQNPKIDTLSFVDTELDRASITKILTSHEALKHIISLEIAGTPLTYEHLHALAKAKIPNVLLRKYGVKEKSEILVQAKTANESSKLWINSPYLNSISNLGINSENGSTLKLSNVKLTSKETDDLLNFMHENPKINTLSFCAVKINSSSLTKITTAYNYSSNLTIKMTDMRLKDAHLEALARGKIAKVILYNCKLNDEHAKILATAPYIKYLDLSHNNIGKVGAKILVESLSLKFLSFCANSSLNFDDDLEDNLELFADSNIRALDLSEIFLDGKLQHLVVSSRLKTLIANRCGLTDADVEVLAKSSLKFVDLRGNPITLLGALKLAENPLIKFVLDDKLAKVVEDYSSAIQAFVEDCEETTTLDEAPNLKSLTSQWENFCDQNQQFLTQAFNALSQGVNPCDIDTNLLGDPPTTHHEF